MHGLIFPYFVRLFVSSPSCLYPDNYIMHFDEDDIYFFTGEMANQRNHSLALSRINE